MKINRITAVFFKQVHDTLRNKTTLIQFVMFPFMAIVLSSSSKSLGLPKSYFINMFSIMYLSMAPIIVIASIVSEDKEKGGLLSLRMANVRPSEYILGVAAYVVVLCSAGIVLMSFFAEFSTKMHLSFLVSCICGLLLSCGLGSIIGMLSKNQSSASGMAVPTMVLFSFLPMMTQFNPSLRPLSTLIYTQQISDIVNDISKTESWLILALNGFAVIILFIRVSKKSVMK